MKSQFRGEDVPSMRYPRAFLFPLSIILLLIISLLSPSCAPQTSQPQTAPSSPATSSAQPIIPPPPPPATPPQLITIPKELEQTYDNIIIPLMDKWKIPGGAVAVTKEGRLVMTKGYGLADIERKEPVQPASLFRLASISKPITSISILKLVQEGKIDFDTKVFPLLGYEKSTSDVLRDPRIYDITIRNLLQHSGGWDSTKSFDPMFGSKAARALAAPEPASAETVIRYMVNQRLDFDPGKQYAYSNFGYCVLGRVIEKVTGQAYSSYVVSQILAPMGITQMRIGRSFLENKAENEVHYYDYPDAPLSPSVFPSISGYIYSPYGGFYLEAMDSHGGWIASVLDIVRFGTLIDSNKSPLKPEIMRLMVSRPSPPLWVDTYYYGMGWLVRPTGNNANWWHNGSLPGTFTLLVRTYNRFVWAILFNSRPKDWNSFNNEVDNALWQAAKEVTNWPTYDLFNQYGYK